MHGFVANTDFDWYRFLKDLGPREEVNFWQPSAEQGFGAIEPGAPFFFKLKGRRQVIAGFGWFAKYSKLPAWLAWEAFGVLNGAEDFPTMLRRIEKYRKRDRRDQYGQYTIGCLMISTPVFFDEGDWIPAPRDWAINIVRGRRYDMENGEGERIFRSCLEVTRKYGRITQSPDPASIAVESQVRDRYGKTQLVKPRLGQGTFRIAVTDAYGRACAITHEHSLPVLEAAHVIPYAKEGPHEISNGILLRSDIHRLFDMGYVTVTPEYRFEVSRKLREDFENGKTYYPLSGQLIRLPASRTNWPTQNRLEWHSTQLFKI